MSKHAKKSDHLQLVDQSTTFVEVPLPLLGAFASIEGAFFDLCVHSGRQVLDAMMEQDREELCGPRWQHDPDRSAGWAYTNDVFPDMSEKMQAALPADHVLRTEGGPPGKGAAWDIYMLYKPGIEWTDVVPQPTSWVMQTIPGYTLIWKNDFGKPPFRSELVDEIRVLMQEALSGEPSLRAANRLLDVD